MNIVLFNAIVATIFLSAISLAGVFSLFVKTNTLHKISLYLVAFSTGALLGNAFFHLLPEAVEASEGLQPFIFLILGISAFFLLERYLMWHHCHDEKECDVHTFTHMSLIGDGLHNFIDGMVVVSAFAVSTELGIATTIAVAAHELPQELGDFGILIHGGFSRTKALLWNFGSGLTAVLGAIFGYFLIFNVKNMALFLLPLAAGGFIYIAMSDLIPELHKEPKLSKSIIYFLIFWLGIGFMLFMKLHFSE